jgi:hypothetical protein
MTADWSDYLDPDERLLWTGRPAQGMRYTLKKIVVSLALLFSFVFLIFWITKATQLFSSESASSATCNCDFIYSFFDWPFVLFGLFAIFGPFFLDRARRAKTHYALTDHRALIIVTDKEVNLKSWPIGPETIVEYKASVEATIYFAAEIKTDRDGDKLLLRAGFDLIQDGEKVYRLIRQIQTGALP